MRFTLQVSEDGQYCRLEIQEAPGPDEALRATDLEQMITALATSRARLLPAVAQSQSQALEGPDCPVDAMSPRWDLALLESGHRTAVLSVAFPGLGWRAISLSLSEAQALGQQLLALSAQGPAHQ